MKHRYTAAISLVITILIFSTIASAEEDKSNATTTTTIIDTDGYELVYLLTTNGEPVKIWIDSIEGNNGTQAHPIDAYIAQSDEYWDHFCGGEGNMFAEEFNPVGSWESISAGEYIEFTISTDDSYYLILDNCDNQRTTDYKANTGSIVVTYSIDDQTDEVGEGILAFLGGSILVTCGGIAVCCGIPFILIVVLLMRRNTVVVQQPTPAFVAPNPAFVAPTPAPVPTNSMPPQLAQPSAAMIGNPDGAGYEWLDYQGSKYWRQANSQSEWTKHS